MDGSLVLPSSLSHIYTLIYALSYSYDQHYHHYDMAHGAPVVPRVPAAHRPSAIGHTGPNNLTTAMAVRMEELYSILDRSLSHDRGAGRGRARGVYYRIRGGVGGPHHPCYSACTCSGAGLHRPTRAINTHRSGIRTKDRRPIFNKPSTPREASPTPNRRCVSNSNSQQRSYSYSAAPRLRVTLTPNSRVHNIHTHSTAPFPGARNLATAA